MRILFVRSALTSHLYSKATDFLSLVSTFGLFCSLQSVVVREPSKRRHLIRFLNFMLNRSEQKQDKGRPGSSWKFWEGWWWLLMWAERCVFLEGQPLEGPVVPPYFPTISCSPCLSGMRNFRNQISCSGFRGF